MTPRATHRGYVLVPSRIDSQPPLRCRVRLRETPRLWINCASGSKYRKRDGSYAGPHAFDSLVLDLSTVEPLK